MTTSVVLDALSSPFEFPGGASPDLHKNEPDYLLSSEYQHTNDAIATSAGFPTATATTSSFDGTTGGVHLGMIWKLLRDRGVNSTRFSDEYLGGGKGGTDSSWELVIFQATLLTLILVVALLWAFCCKNRCIGNSPLSTEIVARRVAALARKISSSSTRDLPPSYSKVDLTVIGLSINDHFNPPPSYDRAIEAAANSTNAEYIAATTVHSVELARGRRPSRRLSAVSTASSNVTVAGAVGGPVWHCPRFHPQPSSQSLPLPPCLVAAGRRRSVLSADGSRSRRVSFIDEITLENHAETIEAALKSRLKEVEEDERPNALISEQQILPCSTIVEMGSSEEESDT